LWQRSPKSVITVTTITNNLARRSEFNLARRSEFKLARRSEFKLARRSELARPGGGGAGLGGGGLDFA